jgi:NNP family nitrate/nitrite transporter-like MFS transporter
MAEISAGAVGRVRAGTGRWIDAWNPNDERFWESAGKSIARRNLIFSIFAEFLGFSVWQMYSVVAALLPSIGFSFSVDQLFWLAALPGLVGATARFPYTLAVPIFGGRNWTIVSALLLLIPALLLGVLVQDPDTPFWMFALAAATAGFGGGNFASSMANISYFYPDGKKGLALGLNAAGGNIGVSVVQLVVPALIALGAFGALVGAPQTRTNAETGASGPVWVQLAGFVWVPLILLAAACAWFFMDNLRVQSASLREQAVILRRKHTWIMALLYTGTFGSFIGYSASFPLLIRSQFPDNASLIGYAFLGPLIGSLIRPAGGWLSDRLGGARVTFWAFLVMILAVCGVLFFLSVGSFAGFLLMFLVLFTTTGIGNGSTFRMIPVIYRRYHEAGAGAEDAVARERARKGALMEAAAALGFTSAVAAYGAFLVPRGYGASIQAAGGPQLALLAFVAFYVLCVAATWWYYYRRGAEVAC